VTTAKDVSSIVCVIVRNVAFGALRCVVDDWWKLGVVCTEYMKLTISGSFSCGGGGGLLFVGAVLFGGMDVKRSMLGGSGG